MLAGDAPLYRQIAESMLAAIPEEWTAAKFEAIFFSESSTYEAEYIRKVDGKARSFQPTFAGSRAFRELRQLFRDAGKPVWGRACLELEPDGPSNVKMKMSWGYDNCDENGDTLFDEEQEVKRAADRHKRLTQP